MSGASLIMQLGGFSQALQTFGKLERPARRELLSALGQEVEGQTRRRLNQARGSEVGPDGKPWPEWSKEYEDTRHENHRMLQDSGRLLDSITHRVSGDVVAVGTNVKYAAVHQFGGRMKRKERKVTVRLRTNARGELLRQGAQGPLANLAVFAKARHKRVRAMEATVPEHEVNMPARPFLGVSERDGQDLLGVTNVFIGSLLP